MPTRATLLLVLAAVVAGAAAAIFVWQPGLASIYDDSVSYLVMAQGLSPWSRPAAAVAAAFPRESYPPFFPLALALFGGAHDWHVAHLLVAACFAATVLLAGLHARAITGSAAVGLGTALTMATLPEAWINLKGILSEFPYMALSLAALLQHRRLREPEGAARRGGWIVLGGLLAATALTRTVGVALVAAVAAAEALRWRRERDAARLASAGMAIAVPLVCAALWYALRPTASGDDTYVRIGSGILRSLRENGAGWLVDSVLANVASLGYSWLHALMMFWSGPWQPRALLGTALGFLALGGAAARAWRGEPDGLYAFFFLGIVLMWPFPGHMYRLGLPIVPVLLAAGWWALGALLARAGGVRGGRYAAGAAFIPLVLCVPALLFYVAARALAPDPTTGPYRRSDIAEYYRFSDGRLAASIADREIGILRDLERIGATTPPAARVMWYLPSYVALLGAREGIPIPPSREPAAFAREVRRLGAGYIYVDALPLRDATEGSGGTEPLAPARLAAGYAETVWKRESGGAPESALLRIDPARLEAAAPP